MTEDQGQVNGDEVFGTEDKNLPAHNPSFLNIRLSSFSVNTIFIVLMLLGISLIPVLSVQLMPSSRSNVLTVAFSWKNAGPELLEMEVTSKLEGVLSRTRGLNGITSQTGNGRGWVRLEVDKEENIDAVKLYVASLVRSVKSGLPEGVKVSEVRGGEYNNIEETGKERQTLLNYVITGPGTSQEVAGFAEDRLAAVVSVMPGVDGVAVSGAVPMEWVLLYDRQILENSGIRPAEISSALKNYYLRREGGKVLVDVFPVREYAYVVFSGNPATGEEEIAAIPVKQVDGRVLFLGDIATLDYREKSPDSYYRINGLNRVNITVTAEKNANIIDLSSKVKRQMEELTEGLPAGYSVTLLYDSSTELKNELGQNLLRTVVTIAVLLLFVFLISRDYRYLLIIALCLAANILVALVFYYFFRVEIHLYTLAGITVSFGIIIDNVIVMTDHYRHHRNRKVFMAILAATLTTMGALTVIFNMDNPMMRNMWDFTTVIIINLMLSLAVALFFVPALMDKIPLKERPAKKRIRRLRRVVVFTRRYRRFIRFNCRFRKGWIAVAVLGFGLPVFLLPDSLDRGTFGAEIYNRIFSTEWWLTARPWVEKSLGGSLRLFIEGGGGEWRQDEEERARTSLNLTLTMPHGATLEQMDEAFRKTENFVAGFPEVDIFTTEVRSANRGTMKITFKEEWEMSGFPEMLKNELVSFANQIGNADSDISGVGRGFSNKTGNEYRSEALKVVGYNYRQVLMYAGLLKSRLEENRRVKKLYIGNVRNPEKTREFAIAADRGKLARNHSDVGDLLGRLRMLSDVREEQTNVYMHGQLTPVAVRPADAVRTSIWELENLPVKGRDGAFRLKDVGKIGEEQAFETITKRNQEYEVMVQYDFIGDYLLSEKVKERVMKEMGQDMPVGFRIKEGREWGSRWWKTESGFDTRVLYILLVFGIIYFICAILLESLRQALAVLLIAPLSFIGCFLGFYFFGLKFNEGGLAAFILMCGLSVNAVLYILNDYNIRIRAGRRRGIATYLSAWNAKIIPIWLTVVSTLLGFVPFLIGKEVSDFWFSLAIGTMCGLVFSVVVLIIYLPMMIKRETPGNIKL